jgi:ribonucleotide reductase alpha subunit
MPCLSERDCLMEYREEGNNIKTTPKNCIVLISYKAYASDNGEYMIPDNENLKEALTNYILYRLYDAKMKAEPNQFNQAERTMHLQRYNILAARAKGELNMPDVGTMENLKNIRTRMMPRTNMFESGFQSLNQPELGNRF